MQFKTIALAIAFALTSSFAFAQAGGGNAAGGAAVPPSAGAAATGGGGTVGSTVDSHGRNEPVRTGWPSPVQVASRVPAIDHDRVAKA